MTRKRLIASVGSLLAKKGFKGIGVNAVAREAGVDKVLIYRYFGGLSGLIAAYGREGDFWPSALELAGGDLRAFAESSLSERLSAMGKNFIRALRQRPVTCEIMVWEMSERNELTEELEAVRESSMVEFFNMFLAGPLEKKNEVPDSQILSADDLQAIVMLMGAAISYLVLRSRSIALYGGLDLSSDSGWQRIEQAMAKMIEAMTRG
ncbi:MAG: TetR/AcrR family transcriptional regulator [Desulfobacteraceae bacterium]|nr:MAG: TetR/AcrR family transcriptional regulator [Desulfobacteraceae bacterium]